MPLQSIKTPCNKFQPNVKSRMTAVFSIANLLLDDAETSSDHAAVRGPMVARRHFAL